MPRKTEEYAGPFPRGRHSHHCDTCWKNRRQGGVYCYKAKCTKPQSVATCAHCGPLPPSPTYQPAATLAESRAAAERVTEIAQWYTLQDESKRQSIFSALSESQRRPAFQYGLAVTWQRLPEYAKSLVVDEWHNDRRAAAERDRIGNTPTCEDCGECSDHCSCSDGVEGCEVCGCLPCSCDGVVCEGCNSQVCECLAAESPIGSQLSLFGGAL